jgi:hypothetical protein
MEAKPPTGGAAQTDLLDEVGAYSIILSQNI